MNQETQTMTTEAYRRRWFRILGLALLVLAAGEGVCRLWDVYDGWTKYRSLLTQTVSYRGQVFSISKPAGTIRVVMLGGSTVYDTVDNYKDSWPYKLQEKLAQKIQKPVEVINLGFWAISSTDELVNLHQYGLELQPDLVIVFDGANDVYNLWKHYGYWTRLYELKAKPILHEKKHHFLTQARGYIKKKSALYQRLNRGSKWIQKELALLAERARMAPGLKSGDGGAGVSPAPQAAETQVSVQDPFAGTEKPPEVPGAFEDRARWDEISASHREIYADNLNKMGLLLHRRKIRGLFIFQPDLSYKKQVAGSVSDAELAEYRKIVGMYDAEWQGIMKIAYPAGIEIMKNTAVRYGFSFYDFNGLLFSNTGKDYAAWFDGYVHFSKLGREKIVNEVVRIINQDKLLNDD